MRKMLSVIFMLLMSYSVRGHGTSLGCELKNISIPVPGASLVFDGTDKNLPKEGCFIFSANVKELRKPIDIQDAENQIIKSMPNWFYKTVQESYGDQECLVQVNKLDYFSILIDYFMEKWGAGGVSLSQFDKFRGKESDSIAIALQEHICQRVKRGEKGMEAGVSSPKREETSRSGILTD